MRINESLVNSLVAATYQNSALALRPTSHHGVIQLKAHWRKQHNRRTFCTLRPDCLQTQRQGLGHHDHARATTKRSIIHPSVVSSRKVTRIQQFDIHLTRFKCAPRDAGRQEGTEHFREQRNDIESHSKLVNIRLASQQQCALPPDPHRPRRPTQKVSSALSFCPPVRIP